MFGAIIVNVSPTISLLWLCRLGNIGACYYRDILVRLVVASSYVIGELEWELELLGMLRLELLIRLTKLL